ALRGRQPGVPRRAREPVRLPHRGHYFNPQIEAQVPHHLPDDRQLLRVFLSEEGDLRPDDVEEFQADRRHAVEVTGTVRTFEGGSRTFDGDRGRIGRRVDLVG